MIKHISIMTYLLGCYYWKYLKDLIFNIFFEYIGKYKLLLFHQSGFWAIDSCVDQLLFIVPSIYTAFEADPTPECYGVFSLRLTILIKMALGAHL